MTTSYGDRSTRGARVDVPDSVTNRDEELVVYSNPYTSDLVVHLAEAGRLAPLARTVAESELNPDYEPTVRLGPDPYPDGPNRHAREDPDQLRQRILDSWGHAREALIRWLLHRYILLHATANDTPTRMIGVYRGLDDRTPPFGWRDLLFFRLYRPIHKTPREFRDAFDAVLTGDRDQLAESTWQRYLGWLAHEYALAARDALARRADQLDDQLVPRIRALLPDTTRTRRRRPDADAAAPGTIRHQIQGLLDIHADVAGLLDRLDWLRTCFDLVTTKFDDRDTDPPDDLDPNLTRQFALQHPDRLEDAIDESRRLWMDQLEDPA